MGGREVHIDVAIIGGGIAGLWALNQLRNSGYSAVLFEREALGGYQTIGSQGMIHGGVKYALSGSWNSDSEAISAMPGLWRQCLAGTGKVDLTGCRVLSEDFYLWSGAALQSRLTSFFASKLLRGHVEKLSADDYPPALRSADFRGKVYRLADLVLDVPSLIAALATQQRDAIFSVDWAQARLMRQGEQGVLALADCTVIPQQLLLTAGTGNAELMAMLGAAQPAMQLRPLQQVLVRHEYQHDFYGHCIGSGPSPRLTVSSHRDQLGRPVWYLGGDLSTGAADEAPEKLIARAQTELAELLPWLELGSTEWTTLRLDRAEPRQSAALKPDRAFVGRVDGLNNTRVAWPTKLTLCPNLGNELERQLAADHILPRYPQKLAALASLGKPPLAQAYWDTLFT